jgi:hypothetical protein
MSWVQPLSKVASKTAANRNLKDEELVKAMMAQAGVSDKPKKPTFLQSLSAGLGAFEWSDDVLKAMKQGTGIGGFLQEYLTDIPRTLAGVAIGKHDWVDPDEGKGVELMKYLGIQEKLPQYILGTAADIFEPSMAVSGLLKSKKVLTESGDAFTKLLAKTAAKEGKEGAAKLITKEFGEELGTSALKRMKSNDDALTIASEFMDKLGVEKGFVKNLDPGFYLGTSAQKGIPIAKGTIPSYLARLIDAPITAPFEIGADVARKTGLMDTKVMSKISKGLERSILKTFDFQHTLKKEMSETLNKVGTRGHAITAASEFKGDQAVRQLEDLIKPLPKKQQEELLKFALDDYIEAGGDVAGKTNMGQFIKVLKDREIINAEDTISKLKGLKNAGLDKASTRDIMNLIEQGTDSTGQMATGLAGKVNLEQVLGTKSYKILLETLEELKSSDVRWNKLLDDIGYQGNKAIETLDDVKALREAIDNSGLDEVSKEFNRRYLAGTFEQNIKDIPYRKALGLGSYDSGYIKHFYNMDNIKDFPESAFKKSLIESQERVIPSKILARVTDRYSPYKLAEETGASKLLKQISSKEAQSEAVKQTHDMYNIMIEQVEQGMLPKFGIEGVDEIPKSWTKTGVPMLDKAGIMVDKEIWDIIKDTNKVLVGDVKAEGIGKMLDKANSFWRGMTTAMTVNVGGKEIPLNPMYYFRNFVNNKMSNVLFGGMNPTLVPERTIQGAKVMNYINSGKGGEQLIGDYKISDIAERYIRNGGLGGTNIDDIRKSLELDRTLGTTLSKLEGRGDLARNLENMDKMALFIDQKLKNVDDIAAMNKVRFALFDYAQLTDVEKTTIKPFFAFYCVPESAEILTRDGWKTHNQLKSNEEVLSYNKNKKVMEWTPLKGVATFEHDQELYEFKNKRYSFMFTDEHKWVTREQKTFTKGKWYGGKESLKKANKLTTGDSLRVLAPYVTDDKSILTPQQARLLGWCLTDGCIRTRKNIIKKDSVRVTLCQHPKKFLEEVIEVAGGNISKPHPTSGTVYVNVLKERLEPIREYLMDKSKLPGLVTRLSRDSLESLFDAMYKADGTVSLKRKKRDSMFFAARDEDERELFRLIATLLGYRTSSSDRGSYLSEKQYIKVEYNLKRRHYKGIVWCPQTDNETWVMRQNGFITITGNTWNKKNFVSFFATLAKDPKRVKVFDDIFKGFGQLADEYDTDIKEIIPDYLQGAYAVITNQKNQLSAIYGFGTNVEAVGDIIGRDYKETMSGGLSALAPAQRILLETAVDYNFFKQKPISEDTSAYAYRNVPEGLKKAIGIEGSTFTDDSGKEVTVYKMNPSVKYIVENIRPASSLLKFFNIATDEGVNNEMMLDFMNYVSGVRYQQYDTEYLRRQFENERYKERMQMLMDEGMVNEYKNFYIPKEE